MEVDWEWENDELMRTGFTKLDNMLSGGLGRGELLEIYGEPGTGKTQICMLIAAEIARKREKESTVLYIDAKNDLLPSRLFDITKKDPSSMRRIRVIRESTAEDIISVLEHFDQEIALGQSRFSSNLRLTVIDSLPSIIYPEMKSRSNVGRLPQEQLSQVIKKFVSQHGVACVTVNNAVTLYERWVTTTSSGSTQKRLKPALGKYWVHMPHFRIFLQRDTSFRPIVRAYLEKATRTPVKNYVEFTINDFGIE